MQQLAVMSKILGKFGSEQVGADPLELPAVLDLVFSGVDAPPCAR